MRIAEQGHGDSRSVGSTRVTYSGTERRDARRSELCGAARPPHETQKKKKARSASMGSEPFALPSTTRVPRRCRRGPERPAWGVAPRRHLGRGFQRRVRGSCASCTGRARTCRRVRKQPRATTSAAKRGATLERVRCEKHKRIFCGCPTFFLTAVFMSFGLCVCI